MSTCGMESDKHEHPKQSCWCLFALGKQHPFNALTPLGILMNLAAIDRKSKVEINSPAYWTAPVS